MVAHATYPTTLKPITFTIRNQHGWVFVYRTVNCGPDFDTVTLTRRWKGEAMDDITMTRTEAREHAREKLDNGFRPVNTI